MHRKASITVNRSPSELQREWQTNQPQFIARAEATTRFKPAPGDRGTEIHVEFDESGVLAKLLGVGMMPKIKDELRRFKQVVETGEVARSEATPEGESAERKLKQRPAQPLSSAERELVGV
jgi:uncharacterized membrane protein